MGYKGRDVEVSPIEIGRLDGNLYLVGACDSCGAIGSKVMDQLQVPARLVGQLTARVTLLEIIAVNALPRMMTVGIASELDPTGEEILEGIRHELGLAGLSALPLVISTEKNFISHQTGLGIGVTGICRKKDLRITKSKPGDTVYCLGLPRVGDEVANARASEIIAADHIRILLNSPGVHDVVPVGSRGILKETLTLALHTDTQLSFVPTPVELDIHKSGGPSTCVVFTTDPTWEASSLNENDPSLNHFHMMALPLFRIGYLTA